MPGPLIEEGQARVVFESEGKWVALDWSAGEDVMRAASPMTEREAEELGDLADELRGALDVLWANEVRVFVGAEPTGDGMAVGYESREEEEEEEEKGDITQLPGAVGVGWER